VESALGDGDPSCPLQNRPPPLPALLRLSCGRACERCPLLTPGLSLEINQGRPAGCNERQKQRNRPPLRRKSRQRS